MMTTKLNPIAVRQGLQKVMSIKEKTDDIDTALVCQMYIELCEDIADGIVQDSTADIMDRLMSEKHGNIDSPTVHSISGGMNNPSERQIEAFKREQENNDEGDW